MFCFPDAGLVIILRELLIQVLSYSSAYLRMIYERTKGQIPRDFQNRKNRKQNIQAKEVYTLKTVGNSIKVLARAMLKKVVAPW